MTGPAYHGWTHRPAAEGGTDPIPVAAAGDLAWAYASGLKSGTPTSGKYVPTWSGLRTNTDGFVEGASITGGAATWIQLNEAGYYLIRAGAYLQSVGTFDTARETELVITYNEVGIGAIRIQNATGLGETGSMWSDSSMQRTGEVGGLGLFTSVTFNYNPDDPDSDLDFASPLQLSVSIDTDGADTASRDIGAEIFLLRLAATPGFGVDLI